MDLEPDLGQTVGNPLRDKHIELSDLPHNWALQKPLADYNTELVRHLMVQNRIVAEKKYNGHRMHILVNNQGEVKLYQRSSKGLLNEYLPELTAEISSMRLPPNTLLDGEVYVPSNGIESLADLQTVIACGDPSKSNHHSIETKVALFDCLLWNGENLSLQPYRDRFKRCPTGDQVNPAQVVPVKSMEEGLLLSKDAGMEGLVLWDLQAPHKLNLQGNTKRGRAYKLKPEVEEDFIAFGFKLGQGQGAGKVGTLTIGKFIGGQPVLFGEVGSGLTELEKIDLARADRYPLVVEIRHFGLDEKGRVTMPSIKKVHRDKSPAEVQ